MYKNIVELILENNSNKNNMKHLNLTASNNKLLNTLKESYPYGKVEDSIVPIVIKEKPSWESVTDGHGTFIKKIYKFGTHKHMMYFINESLFLANRHQHYPEFLIKEKVVEAVLFTKDLNDVSEIDMILSKKFDEIYDEIKTIYNDEYNEE